MPDVDSPNGVEPGPPPADPSVRLPWGIIDHRLHRAWQVGIVVTLCSGLFHLINLVGPSRGGLGPALVTPFRAAFIASWILLGAGFLAGRRRPRLDGSDALVAVLALVFLARGVFTPETLGTTLNWIVTGAGIFFLIKHGVRDKRDIRLLTVTIALAAVFIAACGLVEYVAKQNPLFDSIQIDAIGTDMRVEASSQYYRVRSLIGHPGFVGAILIGSTPLVCLVLWRRRLLLALSMLVLAIATFLTFSRGSWLIVVVFLVPILAYGGRFWLRRNFRWLVPVALILMALLVLDYTRREEVSTVLGRRPVETGLFWTTGNDGPYEVASGEADGVMPINKYLYFYVADGFFESRPESATVIVHYFDKGFGAIHVDYVSWDGPSNDGVTLKQSGYINKNNLHQWTSAAFSLQHPRFAGLMNSGADFRVVDDDSLSVFDSVVLLKGKMKLLQVVAEQWRSRAGSFSTRVDLYPLAWGVFKDNPLGVGLYNSPGTDHHAVDSLPLTWMMEFGWLSVPLLALLLLVVAREGIHAFKAKTGPAVVMFLGLLLLLLHGVHLMILYDKPSLTLFSAIGAIYALVRPWRRGGAVVNLSNSDLML
ncbi:MAG: hypothetical protein ACYCXF_02010 [Thermoleophilia bacterium]